MTRYILFFLLLGIGLHLSAQKVYLPVKVKHQWAFLEVTATSSNLDTTQLYDNLGDINLPWFGQPESQSGYYLIEKAGKLGLMTADFKPVLRAVWHEIHPISNDYFLVADAEGYTIIDASEKTLVQGRYEGIKLPAAKDVSFFMLKKDGKWGVQKKGQASWSIRPDYFALEYLKVGKEGLFKVKKSKAVGNNWRLINWQEQALANFDQSAERILVASQYHIATQKVKRESDWSIRDLTGKELLVLGAGSDIKALNKHLFGYKDGSNNYSVLVMQAQQISPLVEKFNAIKAINEDYVFYRMGKDAGIIDANGSLTGIASKLSLDVLNDQGDIIRIKGQTKQKWGLYSISKQSILQACAFDSIAPYNGNFAYFMQGDQLGVLNTAGKVIAPAKYQEIQLPSSETANIYAYWKDSLMVYPVDQSGNLDGEPYAQANTAFIGEDRYYWPDYSSTTGSSSLSSQAKRTVGQPANYWEEILPESPQDTLWIEDGKSYWSMVAGNYQLMQHEQVEVVVREKSAASKKKKKKRKKKKKKGKKPTPPAPKKTMLVMKWMKKGSPFKMLRKAGPVNWILAYQDNGGLVSNELTTKGKTRRSVRKLNIFRNEDKALIPDLDIIGIRLADFEAGLPFAAFMDVDGKMGLIDREGKQAMDAEGNPLRFTYIGKVAEDKIQVCHPATAFSQVGLNINAVFQQFNVELVKNSGNYSSDVKSTKRALWSFIDPMGKTVIPFEYEWVTPFSNGIAINKKEGKWGAINASNETIIPFEYDDLQLENGQWKVSKKEAATAQLFFDKKGRRFTNEEHVKMAMEGYTLFRVKNEATPAKYGFVDAYGKLIIPHQFDEASNFMDGLATVRKGKKWYFINAEGKETISIDPSIIGIIEVGNFNEGLCPIRKTTILNKKSKRKYGYLNAQGKMAIPAQFDKAGIFSNGLAIVDSLDFSDYKPGQGSGIPRDRGLIDKNGRFITNYEFKRIYPFNEAGFAEVMHATLGKVGIIGKDGKVLTDNYYSKVKSFQDGIAGLDGSYWQLFDYSGRAITTSITDITSVNHFANGDLFVKDKSNRWHHLIYKNGNAEKKQGDFQSLQPFEYGYAFAKMDKQNLLYGNNQSWILPDKGQKFKFWSNQHIGVKSSAGEFYANKALQNSFDRSFSTINKFQGDLALVTLGDKMGLINSRGLFLIPPKFSNLSLEKEGYVKVAAPSQRYGLISKSGEIIVPARYDHISYLNNDIIKVEYADFVGYYRANGEALWELK